MEQLLERLLAQACANLQENLHISKDVFQQLSLIQGYYVIKHDPENHFRLPKDICHPPIIFIGVVNVEEETFLIFS